MARKRYTIEQAIAAFWDKVRTSNNCWEWQGAKDFQGYGQTYYNKKHIKAHRLSYILTKGNIPTGLVVMHSCDNPSCVKPDHLSVGTYSDNTQDAIKKGRLKKFDLKSKTICKRGHDVSILENIYRSPNSGNMCRICKREIDRAYLREWRKIKKNGGSMKKKAKSVKKPAKKGKK